MLADPCTSTHTHFYPPYTFLLIIVKSQKYYFSFPFGSWMPQPCIEVLATCFHWHGTSPGIASLLSMFKSYPHFSLQTGSPSHGTSWGLTSRSTILPVQGCSSWWHGHQSQSFEYLVRTTKNSVSPFEVPTEWKGQDLGVRCILKKKKIKFFWYKQYKLRK